MIAAFAINPESFVLDEDRRRSDKLVLTCPRLNFGLHLPVEYQQFLAPFDSFLERR
jgi:hypothetical protein